MRTHSAKPELIHFLSDLFYDLDEEQHNQIDIADMSQKLQSIDLDTCFQRARYRLAGVEAQAMTVVR